MVLFVDMKKTLSQRAVLNIPSLSFFCMLEFVHNVFYFLPLLLNLASIEDKEFHVFFTLDNLQSNLKLWRISRWVYFYISLLLSQQNLLKKDPLKSSDIFNLLSGLL